MIIKIYIPCYLLLNASDNSNHRQEVNGPDDNDYLEAMDLEYKNLHDKMNAWIIIIRIKYICISL